MGASGLLRTCTSGQRLPDTVDGAIACNMLLRHHAIGCHGTVNDGRSELHLYYPGFGQHGTGLHVLAKEAEAPVVLCMVYTICCV